MGLKTKLIGQSEVVSHGDIFHEIFKDRPHHIPNVSPRTIQDVTLVEGSWGTVGAVILWNYTTPDGKEKVAKEVIESIDEEKKSITFKVIEGDVLDECKSISVTLHVDTSGDDHLVTWILDYEKLHEDVPELTPLLGLCLDITKDIETHHGPK